MSKVADVISRYDLGEGYGDELATLWTSDGDQRESLRSLADRFNQKLLEQTAQDAGIFLLDGGAENLYRLLTSDSVSSADRIEARRRLEQNGVDVDQMEQDFVTYQAIRSYLMEEKEVTYEADGNVTSISSVETMVQRLQSRTCTVAEKSITQLNSSGHISVDEFYVTANVNVICEECGTHHELIEFLRCGGCECGQS